MPVPEFHSPDSTWPHSTREWRAIVVVIVITVVVLTGAGVGPQWAIVAAEIAAVCAGIVNKK
ncbi:hypothetical protein [Streptomyces sp. NBC_00872]|uniref:hypothetical protein n=1 Tax=Streptomyces sp. NBC_00872 TaxID=2903686 RepID=UPI003867254C|nr:hypothetical protein OG214_25995 [Streptomyces sp. NBC_00872]